MLEGEFHNLLKVNDNKKYNGMGYMGCNGYVPCQVFFAFALYSEQGTANTLLKDKIFFLLNNSIS